MKDMFVLILKTKAEDGKGNKYRVTITDKKTLTEAEAREIFMQKEDDKKKRVTRLFKMACQIAFMTHKNNPETLGVRLQDADFVM